MWGEFMMNTPEATLSVIFIAIFIIEHGDKAVGTTSPGPTNATCSETTKAQLRVTTKNPVPMATKNLLLQDPRFVGVKKGRNISIQCGCQSYPSIDGNITWYLGYQNGSFISYLELDKHIEIEGNFLFIKKVHKNHNGIYFCNITTDGLNRVPCGTELMVLGSGNQASSESRNRMKDAIIMIQTILIVLFITVPVLLLMEMKKKRTLKIEDHTYECCEKTAWERRFKKEASPSKQRVLKKEKKSEGLEAYQSPTYEDIQTVRVLASKTMEGEHPCLE